MTKVNNCSYISTIYLPLGLYSWSGMFPNEMDNLLKSSLQDDNCIKAQSKHIMDYRFLKTMSGFQLYYREIYKPLYTP